MISHKKIVVSIILPIIIIASVLIHYKNSEIHNISNLEAVCENNIHRDIYNGEAKESKDLLKLGLKVLEAKDLSKNDELDSFNFENALKILEYDREDRVSRELNSKL